MRRKNPLIFLILITLATVTPTARERKIDRKDLPPAVEKTVREQARGATIDV